MTPPVTFVSIFNTISPSCSCVTYVYIFFSTRSLTWQIFIIEPCTMLAIWLTRVGNRWSLDSRDVLKSQKDNPNPHSSTVRSVSSLYVLPTEGTCSWNSVTTWHCYHHPFQYMSESIHPLQDKYMFNTSAFLNPARNKDNPVWNLEEISQKNLYQVRSYHTTKSRWLRLTSCFSGWSF